MPESKAQEIITRALYELEIMKGNSCIDYGRLQKVLEGKTI